MRTIPERRNLPAVICSLLILAASCSKANTSTDQYSQIMPKGPKPAWGPAITPQMQTVIEALDTLSPVRPTNLNNTGLDITVAARQIHLRIYIPKTGKSTYPLIVYYHGGSWVFATIDTCNSSVQALAEQADVVFISVEYRKGTEFKFPTAHNDAYTAIKWVI